MTWFKDALIELARPSTLAELFALAGFILLIAIVGFIR